MTLTKNQRSKNEDDLLIGDDDDCLLEIMEQFKEASLNAKAEPSSALSAKDEPSTALHHSLPKLGHLPQH